MVRTRSSWLVASVALATFSLVGASCKKEDDKKPESAEKTAEKDSKDKPADKSGDKKPDDTKKPDDQKMAADPGAKPADTAKTAPSTPMPANPNADDLSLLPADSEAVVGINWKQLSGSPLWKEFVEPKMKANAKSMAAIEKFKAMCGFDPMEQITSISFGLKNLGDKSEPEGAVVIHGFDKAKSMACFDKGGKELAEKDGTKVTIDGDVVMMSKDSKGGGFTFINDSTMLMVLGPKGMSKDGVKEVAAGTSALKTSKAFIEMYSKVNTTDSVWLLVNGASKAFEGKMPMGMKLKAVFGSVNVNDGLTVDGRVRFDSADQASQLAGLGNSQLGQAKPFFDKLEIASEGADVKVSVGMSATKLKSLMAMVGGKLGGM